MNVLINELKREEFSLISKIDRSDYSDCLYKIIEGKLVIENTPFNHPGFSQTDYTPYINDLDYLSENHGSVYGAFIEYKIVGICSIDYNPVGLKKDMLNLNLLWVSKNYRRKGVACSLISLCKDKALKRNFSRLYISATPSKNTIDFYFSIGCKLTEDIDPILYEKEPEDIHLELLCK